MKLRTKKIIGLCGILILALVGVLCCSVFNKKEDRLSKAEIAKLRDKYPICGIETLALADIRTLTDGVLKTMFFSNIQRKR